MGHSLDSSTMYRLWRREQFWPANTGLLAHYAPACAFQCNRSHPLRLPYLGATLGHAQCVLDEHQVSQKPSAMKQLFNPRGAVRVGKPTLDSLGTQLL